MPWVEGDEVKVLHLSREVAVASEGGEGETGDNIGGLVELKNSKLAAASHTLRPDLLVEEMWFTDSEGSLLEEPSLGQQVTVNVMVRNSGAFASEETTLSLTQDGTELGERIFAPLNSGETRLSQFDVNLPAVAASTFYIRDAGGCGRTNR